MLTSNMSKKHYVIPVYMYKMYQYYIHDIYSISYVKYITFSNSSIPTRWNKVIPKWSSASLAPQKEVDCTLNAFSCAPKVPNNCMPLYCCFINYHLFTCTSSTFYWHMPSLAPNSLVRVPDLSCVLPFLFSCWYNNMIMVLTHFVCITNTQHEV